MKLSVIFGIAQMTFGVLLSILNARFFRSSINFWLVALPSLAFLASIFIYLCVLIFIKWIFFSVHPANIFGFQYPGSHCAPSLLIGLINMFMYKSRKEGFVPNQLEENENHYANCHLSTWYPNQASGKWAIKVIQFIHFRHLLRQFWWALPFAAFQLCSVVNQLCGRFVNGVVETVTVIRVQSERTAHGNWIDPKIL